MNQPARITVVFTFIYFTTSTLLSYYSLSTDSWGSHELRTHHCCHTLDGLPGCVLSPHIAASSITTTSTWYDPPPRTRYPVRATDAALYEGIYHVTSRSWNRLGSAIILASCVVRHRVSPREHKFNLQGH